MRAHRDAHTDTWTGRHIFGPICLFLLLLILPYETDPTTIATIYVKECSAYVLF